MRFKFKLSRTLEMCKRKIYKKGKGKGTVLKKLNYQPAVRSYFYKKEKVT
jgi:hypothetical protein